MSQIMYCYSPQPSYQIQPSLQQLQQQPQYLHASFCICVTSGIAVQACLCHRACHAMAIRPPIKFSSPSSSCSSGRSTRRPCRPPSSTTGHLGCHLGYLPRPHPNRSSSRDPTRDLPRHR